MENAKIYKIVNNKNDKIYVGSSTYAYLANRMHMHRVMCKDLTGRRNSVLYNHMRDIGVSNFKIELIERCNCEDKHQLREREQFWLDKLKPELNMVRATPNPVPKERTFTAEQKTRTKEIKAIYYEQTKEQRTQPFICDCGCTIQLTEKTRHQKSKKHIELMKNKTN